VRLRVFIASSDSAKPLADALRKQMEAIVADPAAPRRKTDRAATARRRVARKATPTIIDEGSDQTVRWDVIPWFDLRRSPFPYGQTIIASLINECERADLAVTLLTGDDFTIKRGTKVLEPRDNCIFEAGLFMGALGVSPERSVVVTSVDKEALPTDLQGIRHLKFPVPSEAQLNNRAWCRRQMTRIARELQAHASRLRTPPKRPTLPVFSPEDLIDLERPLEAGGDLVTKGKRAVVVNTTQPAETRILIAKQVVANMRAGIDYVYFFKANQDGAATVVSLLQTLVLAPFARKELDDGERRQCMIAHAKQVPSKLLALRSKLFIHFLPADRVPLLFCVHNAGDDRRAKCYLRDVRQDVFMLWAEGDPAFRVAGDLRRLQQGENEPAVFYSTDYFDLYSPANRKFRDKLEHELNEQFGKELSRKLNRLCFLDGGRAGLIDNRTGSP
jgi:hypothetical protein